jgi:type 1 fimbria pilin
MQVRRVATVATVGLLIAGAYAPATAAPKKKPITKTYDLMLLPVQASPTDACATPELEGISVDTQKITPTGPGFLSVKVTGYYGDWDIAVKDAEGTEIAKGSGNDTPNPGAGTETFEMKFKKAEPLQIAICNFAGTPQGTATYTYTYK